jgi:chaperonin GroEL
MFTTIEDKPFEKIKAGVDKIANTVALTLGPNGKNILIYMGENKPPMSTRDGVTVAHYINLPDKLENFGATLIKQAAKNTNNEAGDGTTTSTIMAQAIFTEGLKYIQAGYEPIRVKRDIDQAVENAVSKLKSYAKDVTTNVENVATISANNDPTLGKIIGSAVKKVGKDGSILVENSSGQDTYVSYQEGMILERGWGETSLYFVNNGPKMTVEFDNPFIMVIDDKIYSYEQLDPVMRWVAKEKRPTILCIRDIEDSVLAWLVANKMGDPERGIHGLPLAVIKTPGWNQPEIILDFCDRIGGRLFNADLHTTNQFKPDDLGKAKRVVISKHDTTIVEGAGDITQKLNVLLEQSRGEVDTFQKAKIQDRINRLTNAVATIHVAAGSETELKDKKLRIEDAINATRHAVSEGIVQGGGTIMLKIRSHGTSIGEKILDKALEAPFRKLVENTGENVEKILALVENEKDGWGFNAATKTIENLLESGVIDPVVVTRAALQRASSVATMLLMTGSVIIGEEPKK